jgi:hypothetical protein
VWIDGAHEEVIPNTLHRKVIGRTWSECDELKNLETAVQRPLTVSTRSRIVILSHPVDCVFHDSSEL